MSMIFNLNLTYSKKSQSDEQTFVKNREILALQSSETGLLLVDVALGNQRHKTPASFHRDDADWLWDRQIIQALTRSINACRKAGIRIFYVQNSSPRIATEKSEFGAHARRSWNCEIAGLFAESNVDQNEYSHDKLKKNEFPDPLRPEIQDIYIRKHAYSGFFATRLQSALRYHAIRTLICGGIWANGCLLSTSLDAFFRNYKVIWLADATRASEKPLEFKNRKNTNRFLEWFEFQIGYTLTSIQLIKALNI